MAKKYDGVCGPSFRSRGVGCGAESREGGVQIAPEEGGGGGREPSTKYNG